MSSVGMQERVERANIWDETRMFWQRNGGEALHNEPRSRFRFSACTKRYCNFQVACLWGPTPKKSNEADSENAYFTVVKGALRMTSKLSSAIFCWHARQGYAATQCGLQTQHSKAFMPESGV